MIKKIESSIHKMVHFNPIIPCLIRYDKLFHRLSYPMFNQILDKINGGIYYPFFFIHFTWDILILW